ncbi:hypothetical protein RRG08_005108 [Elysia crispata]|uniref:Uncharacterized protein n=1 Tax=Elysia crispata TaxID=231223 RepID=A0AAE1CWD8_9GAST|nr:hypothetical protein RRG08_005108 [Elysia crispata]
MQAAPPDCHPSPPCIVCSRHVSQGETCSRSRSLSAHRRPIIPAATMWFHFSYIFSNFLRSTIPMTDPRSRDPTTVLDPRSRSRSRSYTPPLPLPLLRSPTRLGLGYLFVNMDVLSHRRRNQGKQL